MKTFVAFLIVQSMALSQPQPGKGLENGAPKGYVCGRTNTPVRIDGTLDEAGWSDAPWTEYFGDIEGSLKPEPRYHTRVKMMWDDSCLYIGAEIEEPDVWANLTKRDTVIFYDNDFEVFIDPNGDNHEYFEFEMNALNTGWDLFLNKPYRDGGRPDDAWDISGLRTAVHVDGTLNDPGDIDRGWSVEMAIPWDRDCKSMPICPARHAKETNGGSISPALNGTCIGATAATRRSKDIRRTTGSGRHSGSSICTGRNSGDTCSSQTERPQSADSIRIQRCR